MGVKEGEFVPIKRIKILAVGETNKQGNIANCGREKAKEQP